MPNDKLFHFECPNCHKRLKATAAFSKRRATCPKCQQKFTVPSIADGSNITVGDTEEPAHSEPQAPSPQAGAASLPVTPRTITAPAGQGKIPRAQSPTKALPGDTETAKSGLPPVAAEAWNSLDGRAIEDWSERKRVSDELKAEKERKRNAQRVRQSNRRASAAADNDELSTIVEPLRPRNPRAAGNGDSDGEGDDLPELMPIDAHQRSTSAAKNPQRSQDASAKRSLFDDDLPELSELQVTSKKTNAETEKLLASHAGFDESVHGDLGGLVPELQSIPARDRGERNLAAARNRSAAETLPSLYRDVSEDELLNADREFRIECKSCGTAQYVRESSVGMKIKCPDCYLQFKIPPPPAAGKKKQKLQLSDEDMPLAAAEARNPTQSPDSQRSRASLLIEKARQQVSDDELERLYDIDFDTAGFLQRTFGFLRDPIAIAHIVGYAIVFAAIFALGHFTATNLEDQYGRGALLMAVIGAPLIGLLFAMPMLSSGIALLESVANRQPRVSEWPGFNMLENAGDIVAITVALLGSLIPGFLLGTWIGGDAPGAGRMQIAGMMLTTFALFPVFLLSMLDNGSVFAPLSNSIIRSFTEAAEAWAGYFLKTFLAFSTVMLFWLLLLGKDKPTALAALAGCLFPMLVFFTCQQIGALADGISEHLSFEFVPPSKDENESQAEGDRVKTDKA